MSQNLNARQQATASKLIDGDLDTPAPGLKEGIAFVFEFASLTSPDEVIVHLPAAAGNELIGELEILSSSASPDAGYQLLRASTVTTKRRRQAHKFQPVGTRWLMVRFTPADQPPQLGISEMEVMGQAGAPVSVYEFSESPVAALQVLEELGSSVEVHISPEERRLFEDAADGTLDSWSLAEAALLASGVSEETERESLAREVTSLEQSFLEQQGSDPSSFDKGKSLLNYLHSTAFQAGYVARQTKLSTVLKDNTYNCVSSAVLYSILGVRLGLDVRGVEVPDHAFAILYDGSDYADIETTTPQGFNPARDQKALEAFQSTTGFSYIPDRRPEKRREISPLELISFIYYNLGVELAREDRYHEALLANFRALSLDRNSSSAVKNALAALSNWSVDLSREGDFDEALEIVQMGLSLAPEDRSLNSNHRFIWQQRINQAADTLSKEEFTAVIAQAHGALPEAGFDSQESLYYINRAKLLAEQNSWRAAIVMVSDAMAGVNDASRKELDQYRLNLVLRWSNREIEALAWEAALDALAFGLDLMPEQRRIKQNIAYVTQEWSESVFNESGEESAEAVIARVSERFPELKSVQSVGRSYAIRRIRELKGAGQYAEALQLIEEYQYLIGGNRDFDSLVRSVFDAQADEYLENDNWEAALAIYSQASMSYPDNKQIKNNLVATWHQWAKSYMDAEQWSEALLVYERALVALPDERGFQRNIRFILQESLKSLDPLSGTTRTTIEEMYARYDEQYKISSTITNYYMNSITTLQKAGAFESSIEVANAGSSIIRAEKDAIKIQRYAYDNWARKFSKNKEWLQAIEIYESGLESLPEDSHLKGNAVATWHTWAETFMQVEDWDGAIEIYNRGLERMPETSLFKQNIRYCEQQRDS